MPLPPLSVVILAAVPLLSMSMGGPPRAAAFVLPGSLPHRPSAVGSPSPSLAYGPLDDRDEERDVAAAAIPSPFSAGDFQRRLEDDLDPACSVEDEDCLAFSSLEGRPLAFRSGANEDPLCDPQDVDCQAFLPKTHLLSDVNLAAELATRSESIETERLDRNWRTARCPTTFVTVSDSDWVRRVAMEAYPVAVCGGASGGLYVVDLEGKKTIAVAERAHAMQVEQDTPAAKRAVESLYGKLDGGGVVAVAVHGDLVASAGREGGLRLWRIVRSFEQDEIAGDRLAPLGTLPGLERTITTSLKFDSDNLLWAACYDGSVRAYNMTGYDDDTVQFPPRKPVFRSDFTDSVLDMHLCEELQLGVCATADGGAALFNLENGQFFVGLMLFQAAARSAAVVKHKDEAGHSVLCGGMDGVIHQIPLNINPESKRVDEDNPFLISDNTDTAIRPKHTGPVMCLASRDDGMFVSGGQDGTLRVWDCGGEEPEGNGDGERRTDPPAPQTRCMYALTGYKLWLGSACTDGLRLVSDGGENSVIVRDFSSEP